jgi:hypothetical protein
MMVATQSVRGTVQFKCYSHDPWPMLVAGDLPELGDWDPDSALPMELGTEFNGCREWTASVKARVGEPFEFKFVASTEWGLYWESGKNRTCRPDDRWTGVADAFRHGNVRE